jgi:hypothetical protein
MIFGGEQTPHLLDLAALGRTLVSPGMAGEVELIDIRPHKRLVFLSRDDGAVTMWQQPRPECSYIIGARWSPEWPVAFVVNQRNGDQVAMFRQPCTPAEFAERVSELCRFYNWAFLVPEIDEADFGDALLRTDYPLDRIFSRRRDPHGVGSGLPEHMGFERTPVSIAQLIQDLDEAIRGNLRTPEGISSRITIRSPLALQECRTFVSGPDGKPGFADGSHGGCVWAAALAAYGLQFVTRDQAPGGVKRLKGFEPLGERKRRRPDYGG